MNLRPKHETYRILKEQFVDYCAKICQVLVGLILKAHSGLLLRNLNSVIPKKENVHDLLYIDLKPCELTLNPYPLTP